MVLAHDVSVIYQHVLGIHYDAALFTGFINVTWLLPLVLAYDMSVLYQPVMAMRYESHITELLPLG